MRSSFVFATALLASAAACSRPRPSVILLSVDSLRYDDLFGQEQGRAIAPHLAGLARESVLFENAYSAAPWTTPAMMSVMTGLTAPAHGVEEHDRRLATSVATLAERFRAGGYQTAAYVPEHTLRASFGFGRGFDIYDLEAFGLERHSSPTLLGKALHQLQTWRGSGKPFFLWVHWWDPHFNYAPPPPFDAAFRVGRRPANENLGCLHWGENPVPPEDVAYFRGQYRGEILSTDKAIGELLDALRAEGLFETTLLLVMADHGEAFSEHGWLTHTNRVDQEVVHVPLLVHWPRKLAPSLVHDVVSTARVGRTLLRLAGLDDRGFGLEQPLPGLGITGASTQGEDALVETVRQGCYTALVGERWKYVVEHRSCRESLFDLTSDPGEKHDLAARETAVLAERRAALRSRLGGVRDAKIPRATAPPGVVQETLDALRSLGYIAAAAPADKSDSVCPFVPSSGRLDTFGDVAATPCPDDGARRCGAAR